MSYHDDPRYIAAQERYVERMTDDETPDSSFARRVLAAYEMYLIQTGKDVPVDPTEADALVAYSRLALPVPARARTADSAPHPCKDQAERRPKGIRP